MSENQTAPLALFEGFGIELEYMIVDETTLAPKPIADLVLTEAAGELTGDFEDGSITWSNELVLHVIELKTTGPARTLTGLENSFQRSLTKINSLLAKHGCKLMPTAMHPILNPENGVKIWPHDNSEIYAAYDRIFDCKGHGWSNLQSVHINLPFANDEEFGKLHTAIRFLLPILPALTASSPVIEGRKTPIADNRLAFYKNNQKKIPSIAGQVIPEPVLTRAEYQSIILDRTYADIAPHDPDELMREDWLNSRGAIARFGRQTIEIRILDVQESPRADIALASLICETLKILVTGRWISFEDQLSVDTDVLKSIFDACLESAERTQILQARYFETWMKALGKPFGSNATFGDLWRSIYFSLPPQCLSAEHKETIEHVLRHGTLSTRILASCPTIDEESPEIEPNALIKVYNELCDCLETGRLFFADRPIAAASERGPSEKAPIDPQL